MTEEKRDGITIVADGQQSSAVPRLSRRATRERDAESAYDEGFDRPRESDFRHKQIFHGWKLMMYADADWLATD
jgi:hypothetical protein